MSDSPNTAFAKYWRHFDDRPDVTIVNMNEVNGAYFVQKVYEAIEKDIPLTKAEFTDIEMTTFKEQYEELEKNPTMRF